MNCLDLLSTVTISISLRRERERERLICLRMLRMWPVRLCYFILFLIEGERFFCLSGSD